MAEEYREYSGRTHRRKPSRQSKKNYPKKLLKQVLVSCLILVFVTSPNLLGEKLSAEVKSLTRTALTDKIDKEKIYKIWDFIIQSTFSIQGESKNEADTTNEKDL